MLKRSFVLLSMVFSVGLLSGCDSGVDAPKSLSEEKLAADVAAKVAATKLQREEVRQAQESALREKECRSGLEGALNHYQSLFRDRPGDAANHIKDCAEILKDPELLEKLRAAELRSYDIRINDKSNSAESRLLLIEMLEKKYPEVGQKYRSQSDAFHAELERQRKDEALRAEQERKKEQLEELRVKRERKSRGVTLGMTKDEVLASSWGRPLRINRTTSAYGTYEQWVYRSGNYLYFENGTLTTIQN